MWALRRASVPLRNRGFSIRASSTGFTDSEPPITCTQDRANSFDSSELTPNVCKSFNGFCCRKHVSANLFLVRRSLSSQAGAKSSDREDELENEFSELEGTDRSKAVKDTNLLDENADELISERDFSEVDDDDAEVSKNDLGISDTETDLSERLHTEKTADSALFRAIADAPGYSVRDALNKWVEEGNEVDRGEVYLAMLSLRKARMYARALQFSEWLEAGKKIEFVERDYASRVDLIAKVYGLEKAEKHIDRIPNSFRGEIVYRTLLANCVQAYNLKKSEEVFNKIKDLEFPITEFACNQLILLYKRTDKRKIADVLLMMEKESVKPSRFTYKLLIDTKGQQNDITGMEHILETMKSEGIVPDMQTKFITARHYASAGLTGKAVAVLKELEGDNLNENRLACRILLQIYGDLGQADEVRRVWKVCESNPRAGECITAIAALGKLKKIEEAEAVFDTMMKVVKKPYSVHYSALLKVYADHKMLTKGKDLVRRMANSGCKLGPSIWDALVKLYLDAGEIEKADAVLQKVGDSHQKHFRPMHRSYAAIMDHYATKGDIHNTEKIFHRMKQHGYSPRAHQFQTLLKAYISAKSPAYGIRERMKAENIFPNRALVEQLTQIDPFRKTAVSELLD